MRKPTKRLVMCLAALAAVSSCATTRKQAADKFKPTPEAELAARRLQDPLDKHLCKAAVYPVAERDWRLIRVSSLAGRGPSFQTALEALCREADGRRLQAVVDIYYWRAPSGWSAHHELRGTAVRYEDSFTPPTAPVFTEIRPPEMARTSDEEPPPAGETSKK